MLKVVGADSLEDLISQTLPASIRQPHPLNTGAAMSEAEALDFLRGLGQGQRLARRVDRATRFGSGIASYRP
ncbi:MAG: glycine dehydrogenase (aminomethyl-transferring) [Bryobacterales bacterium]|jgi:glycine dehydrogenase|nr:glycine dehydrogenase (aminomethyl-transferring) [Bryobacterales bacterium]